MTIEPLDPATEALLQRLETAYQGIDPGDIDAVAAIWGDLLEGEDMRLNRHDDKLTRYQAAIEQDTFLRDHYRTLERLATKPSEQAIYQHAADSRERMITTHEAKLAALEPVTGSQRSLFEEAA